MHQLSAAHREEVGMQCCPILVATDPDVSDELNFIFLVSRVQRPLPVQFYSLKYQTVVTGSVGSAGGGGRSLTWIVFSW